MRERLTAAGLQVLGELQRVPPALRFEHAAGNPERAQTALLREMMQANADTAFGREHGLSDVHTLRDLQRRVPVQTYADVEPWVRRQMNGEERVLSAETPVFFASSTGTTGAPKRTPTTPRFRAEFQRTVFVSMAQVAMRFPAAFSGQILYFVGPKELGRAPCGTPIGYTSGYNFSTLPPVIKKLYAWPYELFVVKDLDARTYLSAWLAAMSPITLVAAIFPLALLHLLRAIETYAEPLARDLRAGTLRDDLALTPEERAFFERYARRDARAADRIEAMARDDGGRLPVSAVMPDLRLVYCWLGASASYYVPELRRRVGPRVAIRDAIYAANEAWGNVTFGEDVLGGPVAITSHVFELVREADWDRGVREGTLPHDLREGERYRLLATTGAGLCRYDLGDIVECTGTYARTPRIRFVRRAGASLSVVGEKLDESHVTAAVASALTRARLDAAFFTAVPRFVPSPRWEIALELAGESHPTDAALEALRADIDQALGAAADDYRVYRRSTLGAPALVLVSCGEHDRTRRAAIARGGQDAQLKTVHLQTDPDALSSYRIDRIIEPA
jgi:GH3 auxin-responsive promoter